MKTMLIDAAHSEDLRIAILENGRLEDFEAETAGKQQLKGNIYIGHVSRVEPSLQAAFITYGGNRNGFLAFGEVHPQFFSLPAGEKADLLEEVAEQAARRRHLDREAEGDDTESPLSNPKNPETIAGEVESSEAAPEQVFVTTHIDSGMDDEDAAALRKAAAMADAEENGTTSKKQSGKFNRGGRGGKGKDRGGKGGNDGGPRRPTRPGVKAQAAQAGGRPRRPGADVAMPAEAVAELTEAAPVQAAKGGRGNRPEKHDRAERTERNNSGNGDEKRKGPIHRRYRIQDVLKEGQKILVQVVKEERGSKGAALTTYFSLPGRYTVLMPNTPYAGGISRKISDHTERQQLRNIYKQLTVPETMGLIIRTAGLGQEVAAIKRDYANLTGLWHNIQENFEKNDDISCVHEDGSVIIRALRDMAGDEIGEIVVSGNHAYKQAKEYAKNLMPEALKLIKEHKDDTPLFTSYKVEQKLAQLHHARVTLPSGGYLIINPTEALVSVDINSGRNTHERNIEETALKTNLEACDELARQIRLRDLAGLIVVDFIDMEDGRNVRKVENAMRKALKRDRARIQYGSISDFGLMEISRQRLRPSFGESHFITCPHCMGSGNVHSPSTAALMILRRLEESDVRGADRVVVTTSTPQVVWILNHKRSSIQELEAKYKYQVLFRTDDSVISPDHKLDLITLKADGSEVVQTVAVNLREQPELPPEERYKQKPERGGNSDRRERERRNEVERSERKEARTDADQPKEEGAERGSRGKRGKERNNRPTREAKPEATAETKEAVKADQPKEATKGKPAKPETGKAKPENKPSKAPAREVKPVEDQPLQVAKVVVDNADDAEVVVKPTARRKFEIRKQADTDRDVPLEVAKVTESTADTPADAKPRGKKSGLLSRLIGS